MGGKIIRLFMWGYQEFYRISVQILARDVLKQLGAEQDAEVLLVGARAPGSNNVHPVCVEPEGDKWSLSLFDGLLDAIELSYKNHPSQNLFFGDEPSMRDKPELLRRDSVRTAVAKVMESFDAAHNVKSFCGEVRCIGEYYVTPVIQIPNATFVQFPALPQKPAHDERTGNGYRSLIHAALFAVLQEATEVLQRPEPGRFIHGAMRDAEEIIRIAAKNFLHTPGLSIEKQYMYTNLFDLLNIASSLMYEGAEGVGLLVLINPDNEAVDFLAKFAEPVPIRKPRWVRKVLQMASTGVDIIADSERIYGLGYLKKSHDPRAQDAFTVAFLGHYHWELRCGPQVLIRSHYAVPSLPQEPFDKEAFIANYVRLFPQALQEDGEYLWELLQVQLRQEHGSMVVVAEDAASEAQRLSKQGTNLVPVRISETLLRSVSGIDGTILLDPKGLCHAIGVILDGEANDNCTPSRGSRYNSGVRYVQSNDRRRLAIVVSDDHTIDIVPTLRKLVSRSLLERHVAAFETATLDNYHESRKWLDNHRFYISFDQCKRLNVAITRLNALPKGVGLIYLATNLFEAHPGMDESYLTD